MKSILLLYALFFFLKCVCVKNLVEMIAASTLKYVRNPTQNKAGGEGVSVGYYFVKICVCAFKRSRRKFQRPKDRKVV